MKLLPETRAGKWSGGLFAVFALFLLIGMLVVASGERGGDTIFSNLKISIPMLLAGSCAIAAFFAGIFGIFRRKERSLLVFVATGVGFLVVFFLLGEVISPH